MKLLFDQNLSPRLVERLASIYPGSSHVEKVGLGKELDRIVWRYAHQNGFVIVTKDVDFSELGLLSGFPPKIVWIRRGNCTTREIERMLRENLIAIESMSQDPDTGVLTLY